MMRNLAAATLAAGLVLGAAAPAEAHKPYLSEGQYGSEESAFEIKDFLVSIVVYHPVTCDALELWLTFEGEAGQPLWVQLGMPRLDRLADYRPRLAVIGPGLPAAPEGFPFAVGEGEGAWIIEVAADAELETFSEPFSQTESYILGNLEDVPLPATGRYRIVAWSPDRRTGKLWVAVGTVEDFSDLTDPDAFYDTIQGVRAFHENAGELDVEEQVCPEPVEEPEAEPDAGGGADVEDDGGPSDDAGTLKAGGGGGCAGRGAGGPAAAWLAGLALAALAARRRTRGAAAG